MNLLLKLFAISTFCVFSTAMATRVGGISDNEKQSGEDVQQLLASLSADIKSAALESFASSSGNDSVTSELKDHFNAANITAHGHKTQLVAGTNYFVRTKIGDYIFHVRIYRDLQKNSSVTKVIGPKEASDPINYF